MLDIFSYVPKHFIDLEQLESIFNNGIDDMNYSVNDYQVERYEQGCELEENISMAVDDLKSDEKKIAFIKKDEKIIAVIGYREK